MSAACATFVCGSARYFEGRITFGTEGTLLFATNGNRESGTARLRDAVAAYREALKEYTRERVPLDWAMSTGNQGVALMWLAKRRSDAAMARMALEQMESADHAPNIAFYDARLRDARALVASLVKP